MSSCVFPGSFDPPTIGHLDLIARAAGIFDHVTVTLMINIHKTGAISAEDRLALLRKVCTGFENVTVDSWDGLLADYMREKGEHIILRGVRTSAEFENEFSAAAVNRGLNDDAETLFLPSDPQLACVSSSVVREIALFGGEITAYVPESIREDIHRLLSK